MKGWKMMKDTLAKKGRITDREIKSMFNPIAAWFIIFLMKRDSENWEYYRIDTLTGVKEKVLKISGHKPKYETVFKIVYKT